MEVVLSQFIGYNLKSADGLLGTVRDFCFDHQSWKVRYLVVDANEWDREIFIPPILLLQPDVASKTFPVAITRKQIYLNVKIDKDAAIVDVENGDYRDHFDDNQAGAAPIMRAEGHWRNSTMNVYNDIYMRTEVVAGSVIRSLDSILGKISDYIIEDSNWQIRYVVIRIEKSISQKYLLMDCRNLNNMRWSEGVAELNL